MQSEKHSADELLSVNIKYKVLRTNVYENTVSQVFLELPAADREFQRSCESALPGCHTQMIFSKKI